MLKTTEEVESDFYTFIKQSTLGKEIRGKVYRADMRPDNAMTEDIVIRFLSGMDNQLQVGVVVANIYIPDIVNGKGKRVRDMKRVGEIEKLVLKFLWDNSSEYFIETEQSPILYHHQEIDQYCVSVKLRFSRMAS